MSREEIGKLSSNYLKMVQDYRKLVTLVVNMEKLTEHMNNKILAMEDFINVLYLNQDKIYISKPKHKKK